MFHFGTENGEEQLKKSTLYMETWQYKYIKNINALSEDEDRKWEGATDLQTKNV